MQWFANARLRAKLLLSFGLVAALLLVVGVAGIWSLTSVQRAASYVGENTMPSVTRLVTVRKLLLQYRTYELQHLLSATVAERGRYEEKLTSARDSIRITQDGYATLVSDARDRELWQAQQRAGVEYLASSDSLLAMSRDPLRITQATAYSRGGSDARSSRWARRSRTTSSSRSSRSSRPARRTAAHAPGRSASWPRAWCSRLPSPCSSRG